MKYVSIGVLLSLLVMPVVAGADVLKVAPTQAVILPSDGSGVTRVALLFDLSDMRGGSGRKINAAHLQWSITGVSANERSEFFLHEATSAWTEAQVAADGNIDYTVNAGRKVRRVAVQKCGTRFRDYPTVGGRVNSFFSALFG